MLRNSTKSLFVLEAEQTMRNLLMTLIVGLSMATFSLSVENKMDLNGTWVLDPARSDSGQTRQGGRTGGYPGERGGFPGIGLPGIGYPGIGGYPGGYPGVGGYPGGRRAGSGYPGGRDGNDGDSGEGMPPEEMQNLTLHVIQTDSEVQTTRTFTVNGRDQTITQKFALDGSENSNPASMGRGEFVSKSSWKDNKLVNLGTQTGNMRGRDYSTTVKEEYTLSKGGKTLTIKTTRSTPRGERSFKQVFDRQESDTPESSASGT